MKLKLSAVLVLHVFFSIPSLAADTRPHLTELAVSGSWQPKSEDSCWQVLPDRIRFLCRSAPHQEQDIIRREPLPQGDWTIDFWTVQYDWPPKQFMLYTGQPDSHTGYFKLQVRPESRGCYVAAAAKTPETGLFSKTGYDCRCGAGYIHWVRIVYSRQENRMCIFLNGQPVSWEGKGVGVPCSPVGFRMYRGQSDYTLDLMSFRVTAGAQFPPHDISGPVFQGWRQEPQKGKTRGGPELGERVASLLDDASLSDRGRAYVLATMALLDYGETGRIGADHWRQIAGLTTTLLEKDRYAASIFLPIVIASGDELQREEARSWVETFFDMPIRQWQSWKIDDHNLFFRMASMLDPEEAALAAAERAATWPLANSLAGPLAESSPECALALYTNAVASESNPARILAWLLPEFGSVAPNYARLAEQFLDVWASRKSVWPREPDSSLSFAAYRLAPSDSAKAMTYWERIQKPEVRAETLEYMSKVMPGRSAEFDQQIEACLKEAIDRWHSTKPNDTPVSEMVRLARWYQSRGRMDDAISTLKEAVERSNSLSDERFRCELDIARLMKEFDLPGAEIWWKKAESSAIGRDQGANQAGPGFLYISAVSLMAMDLVREDRIDDALALLKRMNPDLADNRARCLSAIVQRLSSSDLPRAVKLLKEMPSCPMRDSTIVKVAPKLAKQDLEAALELVEMIPAGYRAEAGLAIAEVVPLGKSRALDEICQQAVTSHIEPEETSRGVRRELLELLSRLPVTSVLALEPSFKDDKALYAQIVMNATAATVGLTDDPLWQEFTAATKPLDGGTPWHLDSLRYAVR